MTCWERQTNLRHSPPHSVHNWAFTVYPYPFPFPRWAEEGVDPALYAREFVSNVNDLLEQAEDQVRPHL